MLTLAGKLQLSHSSFLVMGVQNFLICQTKCEDVNIHEAASLLESLRRAAIACCTIIVLCAEYAAPRRRQWILAALLIVKEDVKIVARCAASGGPFETDSFDLFGGKTGEDGTFEPTVEGELWPLPL